MYNSAVPQAIIPKNRYQTNKIFKNLCCFPMENALLNLLEAKLGMKQIQILRFLGFQSQINNQPFYQMSEDEVFVIRSQRKPRTKREKYSKVSLKSKIFFFKKVIHEQGDLRQVAKILGIKYSTAKTLVRNYKSFPEETNEELVRVICQDFQCKLKARKRCSYRSIDQSTQACESSMKQENGIEYLRPRKVEIICSMISYDQR